jgi:hypothetical protein
MSRETGCNYEKSDFGAESVKATSELFKGASCSYNWHDTNDLETL